MRTLAGCCRTPLSSGVRGASPVGSLRDARSGGESPAPASSTPVPPGAWPCAGGCRRRRSWLRRPDWARSRRTESCGSWHHLLSTSATRRTRGPSCATPCSSSTGPPTLRALRCLRRRAERAEQARDPFRVAHERDELEASLATRAREHVDGERAREQLGPEAAGASTLGLGLGVLGVRLVRGILGRDARAPPVRRREHASVLDSVKPRRRHSGGEARDERERVQLDGSAPNSHVSKALRRDRDPV